MNDINTLTLVGRMVRDAELKYTNSGLALTKFAVATNTSKKVGQNYESEANFFDVTLFGRSAEAVYSYLKQGKQIVIQGNLKQNRWVDSEGQKRSRVEIIAQNVQLVGSRDSSEPPQTKKPEVSDEDIF